MREKTLIQIETLLYSWACGQLSNQSLKNEIARYGLYIDLRQPDLGNWMEVYDSEGNIYSVEF